jgi:predicted phosphodiesterase
MLYCVISDIHGNLEALEAVLRHIDSLPPSKVLCLGDLVGYNADPDACVQAVLSRALVTVRGNHDKAVARLLPLDWFNPVAREAVLWTRKNARPDTLRAVSSLREGPVDAGEGIMVCHGSPMDEDRYLMDSRGMGETRDWLVEHAPRARICFHGHTHVPVTVCFADGARRPVSLPPEEETPLEPGALYVVNPGSVGQPRDGNAMASFGILDLEKGAYRTVRVPYGVPETQRKILAAGLPRELARRLEDGW